MQQIPLSKTKIETKLAIVREAITELRELVTQTPKEHFIDDKVKFGFAEHHLRRALEAIFDIGGHIISRFPYSPAQRPKEYKEIAIALGVRGIVDEKFAREILTKMAGYRNRLVHFYHEVTKEELFDIITNKLGDVELFARAVVDLLEHPEKYNLTVAE